MEAQRASARVLGCGRGASLAVLLSLGIAAPDSAPHAHAQAERPVTRQNPAAIDAPLRGGVCQIPIEFSGFNNIPIGAANVQVVGNALVVSNLGATTSGPGCTPPGQGVEVCLNPVKDLAGEQGGRIEFIRTSIPDNVTSLYVQVEEYWGLGGTSPAWETDPVPVGFRTAGGSITACGGFNVCPIKCDEVEVQFKETPDDASPDTIICPGTNLFSISDSKSIPLRRILIHGACPDGGCSTKEVLDKVAVEFVFASDVDGFVADAGCTPSGMGPYSARSVVIKPNRPSCSDNGSDCTQASCCNAAASASRAATRGANTPPMESVKLMADYTTGVAGTAGRFIIVDEAVCSPTETVCNDGFDDDCDGRVDARDSDCPSIPAASAWGVGIFAIALCIAAALLLRRTPSLSTGHT